MVRSRPGMFIGSLGKKGITTLLLGFFRELLHQQSAITEIGITLHTSGVLAMRFKSTNPKALRDWLDPSAQSSHKYFNTAIVVALSEQYHLTYLKTVYCFDNNGQLTRKKRSRLQSETQYLQLDIRLAASILEAQFPDYANFPTDLFTLAVCRSGVKISCTDHRSRPFSRAVFYYPKGVVDVLKVFASDAGLKRQQHYLCIERDDIRAEIAWCFDVESFITAPFFWSAANDEYTEAGGSHLAGVLFGYVDFVKKKTRSEKQRYRYSIAGIVPRISVAVAVWTDDINYAGSQKQCVTTPKLKAIIRKEVSNYLDTFCKMHPDEEARIIGCLRKEPTPEEILEQLTGDK